MKRVYLSGALSSSGDIFAWQDSISDEYDDHEFVNPYTLNDFDIGDKSIYEYPEKVVEPALEELEQCDGMLVHWQDSTFLVGTVMEIKHAWENDIPVMIWYEGNRDDLSPWLQHTTVADMEDRTTAINVLLSMIGEDGAIH